MSPEDGLPGGGRLERAAATDRRLLSASSATFVSRAFAKAAQVLFLVVAARLLSVEEFAAYSYVLVIAAAFTIVSDTGVPLVSSRDMAAGHRSPGDLFWAAAPIVLVSAVLAGAVLCVFGFADAGPGSSAAPVLLAAGFVVANRLFDFTATTLRGLGRLQLEAVLQAAGAAVFIAAGVAAAAAGLGVGAIVGLLLVKELVSAVVAYAVLRPELGPPRRASGVDWRALLRSGISLSLAGTALAIVMRLPLTVLGNSGTAEEVAVFSAAQRFGDGVFLLTTTAGFALLPGLAYLAANDPRRVRTLLTRVVLGSAAVATVAALAALPLSGQLMELVYGADYRSGGSLLQVMLAGLPAYAVLGVCWYALVALGGERSTLGLGLSGLVASVVLALVLIPASGDTGAAWTYMAALVLMAAGSAVLVVRRIRAPMPAAVPGGGER